MPLRIPSLHAIIAAFAACNLAQAADQVIGSTATDRLPQAGNWQYTLQLDGKDNTSIGFHDSMHSVSSIRYNGSTGFTIGGNDGWGVKPVAMPGDAYVGGNLDLNGTNRWLLHTPDDGRQDFYLGHFVGNNWDWPYMFAANGTFVARHLWIPGNISIQGGQTVYSTGRMHIHGEENLYLLNKGGTIISKAWGGNGNLTVEGTLRSSAIATADLVVKQAWWGDFVFADDYQLMPLPELKQYIQANRHLPGIPDQATIVKDGVQVNEMLALHMVKIEEQTRHLIEQHETIGRQERAIADQQKTIAELQKAVVELMVRQNRLEAAAGMTPSPGK